MAETARADEQRQAAAAPESRLAQMRRMFAGKGFDPVAVVIEEIQREPVVREGAIVGGLSASEKVQAALGLERLAVDWKRVEIAESQPRGGLRGKATMTPDGQFTLDFGMDDGKTVDELRDELQREAEAAGFTLSFARPGDAGKPE